MVEFALIILLVLADGTGRMAASPHESLEACEAAKEKVVEDVRKSGAAQYVVECAPVRPVLES